MNDADEQFFEALVEQKASAEKEYGVELAKAGGAVAARSRMMQKEEKNDEVAYDDGPEGQLTVDVYQTAGAIVVESAIAGVKPEDIDINVTNDSVTIRGSRHREKEVKDDDYLYQECYWGRFSRSIVLPQEIDPEGAMVSFKNGILTLRLPKRDKQRSRKLKVKIE